MINFILGESGCGKSTKMIEIIKEKAREQKKIFVIIPEQFSFEYERKLYDCLGSKDFNSIEVFSFTRLARHIFDTFGCKSGEYASDNVKVILMYLVLKELNSKKAFLHFIKQAGNRNFISDALSITSDLRRTSLTPERFSECLKSIDSRIAEKASDISLIYSAYDREMSVRGYKDNLTDITEAAAYANMNDYFENSVFFVDEFESFSPDEQEMLDVIIAEAEDIYFSLCTSDTSDTEFSLFATVNKTYNKIHTIADKYEKLCKEERLDKHYRYKNDAVLRLSTGIFRRGVTQAVSGGCVGITEAKDLYAEADFVCAEIKRLVSEEGYHYGEISVSSRQLEDYTLILQSAMERYDIPYFIDTEKSVMHMAPVLLLKSVLEIISSDTFSTDDLFRYAKTGLAPISLKETGCLENFCYKWNIDGDMWLNNFHEAVKNDEDSEQAEELRKLLIEPLIVLKKKCQELTGGELCNKIYEFLSENHIDAATAAIIDEYISKNMPDMASEINRIWNCIIEILDSVAEVLENEKVTPAEFRDLFIVILKQNKFLSPPQKLDCVSVVSAEKARLNNPSVMFVMGVNEGILPYSVKSSGLLSDSDREAFAEINIDISKDTKRLLVDERFTVYRLFSFASERTCLTYSLSDASGSARYPSYITPQIKAMYEDNISGKATDYDLLFYSPTIKAAYYNYVQHMNEKTEEVMSLREALISSDEYREYRDKIHFLDELDPEKDRSISDMTLINKLMGDKLILSATSIQSYNLCHFKFYCQYGLNLFARKKKSLGNLETGQLVHHCLEKIFSSCATKKDFLELTDDMIAEKIHEFSAEYRETELGGDLKRTARFDAVYSKFTESIFALIQHLKEELSYSEFIPVKYEFEISEKNGVKPFSIKTSDGIEIVLKGKIDRIDKFEKDGETFIRIIDYKTGEQTFSIEKILQGIDMQLMLYLFSVTGQKSPFSSPVPAGVLYMPSGNLSLDRERDSEDTVEDYMRKKYHMSGIVLYDQAVLNAMEKDIAGIYIPAKVKKSAKGKFELNEKVSHTLTRKQFERMKKYIEEFIIKLAEELYKGNISACPLIYEKSKDVCRYCDYKEICGNVPRLRSKSLPPDSKEKAKEFIDSKE